MKQLHLKLLALCIAASTSISVQAQTTAYNDGTASYSWNGSGYTITTVDLNKAGASYTIPDSVNGYPVTAIQGGLFGNGTKSNNTIKSVHIPATVKQFVGTIGGFKNCKALEEVTFAEGSQLQSIPNEAFNSCNKLKHLDLTNCEKLSWIGGWVFDSNHALVDVHFPSSLKSIGDGSFGWCVGLRTVEFEIGSQMETIGKDCFHHTSIRTVNLEACTHLTTIGSNAFNPYTQPKNLTELVLPASVTTIGSNAFANQNKLEKIVFQTTTQYNKLTGLNANWLNTSTGGKLYVQQGLDFPSEINGYKVVQVSADKLQEILAGTEVTIDATSHLASYSNSVDVKVPDDMSIYYAKAVNGNNVTLQKLEGNIIPAGLGVILSSETVGENLLSYGGNIDFDLTSTNANLLIGTGDESFANYEAGSTYYALADGERALEPVSLGNTIPAHKAYLKLNFSADKLFLVFYNTSGIRDITSSPHEGVSTNAPAYNLAGQRVGQNYRGIIIVNGKKILRK